jgi:hypothetical protein
MTGYGTELYSPPGRASDEAPEILATGRSDVTILFTSMSARDPLGADAEYLRWHTFDHRPEQFRLDGIRSSLRIASTPACRAARAASDPKLDATDHVMTYFFTGAAALEPFNDLATALRETGRMSHMLPSVQRGVYSVCERHSAHRVKLGADVLPWWPAKGVYLLIETGAASAAGLVEVPGVAGIWQASAAPSPYSSAAPDQHIAYLFLDGEPLETAEILRPMLQERWDNSQVQPLLAAPFYCVIPHEWDRYLP